jgi:hypothetical protein
VAWIEVEDLNLLECESCRVRFTPGHACACVPSILSGPESMSDDPATHSPEGVDPFSVAGIERELLALQQAQRRCRDAVTKADCGTSWAAEHSRLRLRLMQLADERKTLLARYQIAKEREDEILLGNYKRLAKAVTSGQQRSRRAHRLEDGNGDADGN